MKELRLVTMYKNNSRDSSKFKDCSPLQLHCKLKVKYSAVGYYSYYSPFGRNRSALAPERAAAYANVLLVAKATASNIG